MPSKRGPRLDGPDAAINSLEYIFVFQSRFWRPGARRVSDLHDGYARLTMALILHYVRVYLTGTGADRDEARTWLFGPEVEPWYEALGLSPECARRWIHDAEQYIREWKSGRGRRVRRVGMRYMRAKSDAEGTSVLREMPCCGEAEADDPPVV